MLWLNAPSATIRTWRRRKDIFTKHSLWMVALQIRVDFTLLLQTEGQEPSPLPHSKFV